MALTANTLPSVPPAFIVPFDANLRLATAGGQTLTATGYMGAPDTLDVGFGRIQGMWAVDITAIDVVTGDERYDMWLLGSNDVAWGNGNVEALAFVNVGGATGRPIATILGASPAIPPTGLTGTMLVIPWTNLRQRIVYRYVRGYLVIAGTTPTITLQSWLSYDSNSS